MREGTIFEGTRSGCLVMVVSITEVSSSLVLVSKEGSSKLTSSNPLPPSRSSLPQIGSSAFNLQRILHDRQEARSGVAKIRRLVGEEVEEEDEEGDEGPKYPRGMLKLELSDGFNTVNVSLQSFSLHTVLPF